MMNAWKEYCLSEIISIIGGGTPKRSNPRYWNGNIPWLSVKDFNNSNRYVSSSEETITEEGLDNSSTKLLLPGQLIISARGTVGALAQLKKEMAFNQSCYGLNGKENLVINDFLYYLVKHSLTNIQKITHGAVFDTITKNTFEHIKVKIPSIPVQRKIANILGSLDDKIELNRQMNQTLESMARAIFKSWFVDFDPVYAKIEGQNYPLPPEIMDLFPDELEESELGMIPKGWRVSTIGEEVQIVGGGTPSTKNPEFWENGIYNFATPKDLSDLASPILIDTERKVTEKGLNKISSGLLSSGTLLMSSRAPVGYLAIAEIPLCINQGFIAMKCNQTLSNYYMLNWAKSYMDDIKGRASGTTFAEISKANFRPMDIIIPCQELVRVFNNKNELIFKKILVNLYQEKSLEKIRNFTLPKLINGEIEIYG